MSVEVSLEPTPAVRLMDADKTTVLYADPFAGNVLLSLESTSGEAILGQILLTVDEISALASILEELQELGVVDASEPDEADFIDFDPVFCPLCAIEAELPTEIGAYLDAEGDVWILSGDGHWYDSYGDTQEPDKNYQLVDIGPFTRIPNASELFKV